MTHGRTTGASLPVAGAPAPDVRAMWRRRLHLPLLLLALLLHSLLLGITTAQENLYGPEAPRDTAYVRFFNATPGEPQAPALDGEAWEAVEYAGGSAYRAVQPGEHTFTAADGELPLTLGPESFTTVVLLPGGPLALEDTALRDISRGLLTFYNLSADETLTLRTADGSDVFSEVPPGSSQSVAISEAEVGLVVYRDGEEVAALEPRLFPRGEAHSVLYLPGEGEARLVYLGASAEF